MRAPHEVRSIIGAPHFGHIGIPKVPTFFSRVLTSCAVYDPVVSVSLG